MLMKEKEEFNCYGWALWKRINNPNKSFCNPFCFELNEPAPGNNTKCGFAISRSGLRLGACSLHEINRR